MNTYEYRCNNCQHEFETQQHFKDKPLTECPECKQNELERLMSIPSVISMGPQTLGGIADKNTAKMGKYQYEKKEKDFVDNQGKAKKRAIEEGLKLKGLTPIDTSKIKKPWYSKDAPDPNKLANLTAKQKKDYVEKGTLPT